MIAMVPVQNHCRFIRVFDLGFLRMFEKRGSYSIYQIPVTELSAPSNKKALLVQGFCLFMLISDVSILSES